MLITDILIGLVAFLHLYFLWFEMFAWKKVGKRLIKAPNKTFFDDTKAMAANQGLYNGFLAAGLIWSLVIQDETWSYNVALFFLACVCIAGVYGAFTANRKILYIQALPAALALLLLIL